MEPVLTKAVKYDTSCVAIINKTKNGHRSSCNFDGSEGGEGNEHELICTTLE